MKKKKEGILCLTKRGLILAAAVFSPPPACLPGENLVARTETPKIRKLTNSGRFAQLRERGENDLRTARTMQFRCNLTWGKQLALLGGRGEELPPGEHLEQRRHARRRRLLPLGDRQAAAAGAGRGGAAAAALHVSTVHAHKKNSNSILLSTCTVMHILLLNLGCLLTLAHTYKAQNKCKKQKTGGLEAVAANFSLLKC